MELHKVRTPLKLMDAVLTADRLSHSRERPPEVVLKPPDTSVPIPSASNLHFRPYNISDPEGEDSGADPKHGTFDLIPQA